VGDGSIIVALADISRGIPNHGDTLLGEGVIDDKIAAADQKVVVHPAHYGVRGLPVPVDIGYDENLQWRLQGTDYGWADLVPSLNYYHFSRRYTRSANGWDGWTGEDEAGAAGLGRRVFPCAGHFHAPLKEAPLHDENA
jgi:hypothetical protein